MKLNIKCPSNLNAKLNWLVKTNNMGIPIQHFTGLPKNGVIVNGAKICLVLI